MAGVFGTLCAKVSNARMNKEMLGIRDQLKNFIEVQKVHNSEWHQSINKALSFPLSVNEDVLKNHRIVLHKYHRTRNNRGDFWSYRKLDFSEIVVPGRLLAKKTVVANGKPYEYEYDGFIVESRLILTTKAQKHKEEVAIEVFRDYATSLHNEDGFCGIQLHHDWIPLDGWDPSIITNEPLFNSTEENYLGYSGRQPDDIGKKLTEQWILIAPKVGMGLYKDD